MPQSIFLGPHHTGGGDSLRSIEEKLNADFSAAFAQNPALAAQQQILRIAPGKDHVGPDSVGETQAKINAMLSVLGTQAGLQLGTVQLDPTRTGGITPAVADQLTVALAALGGVPSLGALGLTPLAVTRNVAYTGTFTGATATSVLTASGLPAGLTINTGPRTITGTTAAGAGNYPIVVTETLAGRWGSPRANNFTLVLT